MNTEKFKLLNITDPDAELKSMRIESTSIYPRTINDSAYGGACSIVLPNKGFITGDASIVLPAIAIPRKCWCVCAYCKGYNFFWR